MGEGDEGRLEPHPDSKTVVVHRAWHDSAANMIAGWLRASGIPCSTVSDVPHSVYPLNTDGLGEVRIIVAEEDADEARRKIAEWESRELTEDHEVPPADPEGGTPE